MWKLGWAVLLFWAVGGCGKAYAGTDSDLQNIVTRGVVFLRENSLPICEWGNSDRSYWNIVYGNRSDGTWTCQGANHEGLDDSCTFRFPDQRPLDSTYVVRPRQAPPGIFPVDGSWADGTAVYGLWFQRCTNTGTGITDSVDVDILQGDNIGFTCIHDPFTIWKVGPEQSLLAQVAGGTVEHIRTARVRGHALISFTFGPDVPSNSNAFATVALQVFTPSGWKDMATASIRAFAFPAPIDVEAQAEPGQAVRLQVRASAMCDYFVNNGYNLQAASIQVETCVPDQSHPGSCL